MENSPWNVLPSVVGSAAGPDLNRTLAKQASPWSLVLGHPAVIGPFLGILGLLLFLGGISKPHVMLFDEGFFVPEARSFLQGTPVPDPQIQMHSLAKPPLGKMIMAAGMSVSGDNPFGWRVASALCGALALVAAYFWALLLVHDRRLAALAAGLTLFNNFLFVMSRTGMMDMFLVFFLMWSLLAYTAAITLELSPGRRRLLLIGSGVLIGLAGACKWNAIDSLAALVLVSVTLLWLARRLPADSTSPLSRQARNMEEIGFVNVLLGLVVAPLAAYAITYWPQCRILKQPFSIHTLIEVHRLAWRVCTTWVTNRSIVTPWYAWPLHLSPQRGFSYLLGNPVVAWGGLAALVFCLWRFCKTASLPEGFVLLLYAANLFQWAVTPEKGLLYYYYFPAIMVLGIAIVVALQALPPTIFGIRVSILVLIAAGIVFLWCYPRMAHLEAPWDCALGCWI